jgi:hypothetical protein
MSNNLPAVIEGLSDDEIMEMTGQTSGNKRPAFPFLSINHTDETDDGDLIPKGTYAIYLDSVEDFVYGTPARFRPFINAYQYRVYDAKEKKTINKSIIFKSWNDEKFDELGGLACGKLPRKKYATLNKSEQKEQDNIKCKRYVFGTVSFDGVLKTAKGSKDAAVQVKVENVPCLWRSGGGSFKDVQDALDQFTNAKKQMFNHHLVLTTKREKVGTNVYYAPVMAPDLQTTIPLTKEDLELMRRFQAYIVSENNETMDKWRNASSKKANPVADKDVIDVVAELAPPPELNDELPASMRP